MTQTPRTPYLLIYAIMTMMAAPCVTMAAPYLTWQNKTPQSAPAPAQIHTNNGAYNVPASPYGQIGDPYAKSLQWPTKDMPLTSGSVSMSGTAQTQTPRQAPPQTARPLISQSPTAQSQSLASISPTPVHQPPVRQVPARETYVPQAAMPAPVQAPAPRDPVSVIPPRAVKPQAPEMSQPDISATESKPVQAVTVARSAPVATSAPVTSPAPADGYKVPATSKYAARIEAARALASVNPTPENAAQAAISPEMPAEKPVAKPEPKPEPKTAAKPAAKPAPVLTATAPVPSTSLASQETDHVFIPGEHYTSAADEPRYYSLHRQYGLAPDPITITQGATGALLSGTMNTVEGGDPNADKDSGSSSDKDDLNLK